MGQSKTTRNFIILVVVIVVIIFFAAASISIINTGTASVQATIDAVRHATSTP